MGWFFGEEKLGEFDVGLYGYVGVIMVYMDMLEGRLGGLVRRVGGGGGELVGWWERIRCEVWGGDGLLEGGEK